MRAFNFSLVAGLSCIAIVGAAPVPQDGPSAPIPPVGLTFNPDLPIPALPLTPPLPIPPLHPKPNPSPNPRPAAEAIARDQDLGNAMYVTC